MPFDQTPIGVALATAPRNLRGFALYNSLRTDLNGLFLLPSAEEVWRILPPDKRLHVWFSGSRMRCAKLRTFRGAVARATLIGVN